MATRGERLHQAAREEAQISSEPRTHPVCRRCGQAALERRRLPGYLRWLRRLRLDLRAYRCAVCDKKTILRGL